MIYLDTHCAIWIFNSQYKRFTRSGLERMESDDVRISPVVLFEMELLFDIGRLNRPAQQVAQRLEEHAGIAICQHPFHDVALASTWLKWTRDPFDRLLCGHALAAGGDLLTRDETILKNFPNAVW